MGAAGEKSSSYDRKPRGRDGQTEPADRRAVSQATGEGSSSAEPNAGKAVHVHGNEAPSEAMAEPAGPHGPWGCPPPTQLLEPRALGSDRRGFQTNPELLPCLGTLDV